MSGHLVYKTNKKEKQNKNIRAESDTSKHQFALANPFGLDGLAQ